VTHVPNIAALRLRMRRFLEELEYVSSHSDTDRFVTIRKSSKDMPQILRHKLLASSRTAGVRTPQYILEELPWSELMRYAPIVHNRVLNIQWAHYFCVAVQHEVTHNARVDSMAVPNSHTTVHKLTQIGWHAWDSLQRTAGFQASSATKWTSAGAR
jgi:hypothetical protein